MSEITTTFRDERGRDWEVKLTVPILYSFCKAEKLPLDALSPVRTEAGQVRMNLSVDQLLLLAYHGTRYQSRAIAHSETLDEFLAALDGPSFMTAQMAAVGALVAFFLRAAPPQKGVVETAASLGTGVPSSV